MMCLKLVMILDVLLGKSTKSVTSNTNAKWDEADFEIDHIVQTDKMSSEMEGLMLKLN